MSHNDEDDTEEDLHLVISLLKALDLKLQDVEKLLSKVVQSQVLFTHEERHIMADLSALTAEVAQLDSVEQSVVALLNGLGAQVATALASAGVDQATIDTAVASITTDTNALAAAVTANTPASTPTPPA